MYSLRGSGIKCTHPQVVCELEGEDSDALIVERASDGAGDVPRDDGDEAGGQQPGSLVPQLPRQEEGGDGRQAAEHRRQKDADIPDMHRHMQHVQHIVDKARSDHQPGVHLDSTERRRGKKNIFNP